MENPGIWVTLKDKYRPINTHFTRVNKFVFSAITTGKDRSRRGDNAPYLKKLLKALPQGPFTLDLDLDYFASIDSTDYFQRSSGHRPKWWKWKKFKKQRMILKGRLQNFANLLAFLKKKGRVPSVITIADSTFMSYALDSIAQGQSEYTPIEHTAYLRRETRKIFKKLYGVSPIKPNKEQRMARSALRKKLQKMLRRATSL